MATFPTVSAMLRSNRRDAGLVVASAIQDLISDAQADVPVDTGALRASLQSGIEGAGLSTGESSFSLTLAGFDIGDVYTVSYSVNYAIFVHDGTSRLPGRPWLLSKAAGWQGYVNRAAARF